MKRLDYSIILQGIILVCMTVIGETCLPVKTAGPYVNVNRAGNDAQTFVGIDSVDVRVYGSQTDVEESGIMQKISGKLAENEIYAYRMEFVEIEHDIFPIDPERGRLEVQVIPYNEEVTIGYIDKAVFPGRNVEVHGVWIWGPYTCMNLDTCLNRFVSTWKTGRKQVPVPD